MTSDTDTNVGIKKNLKTNRHLTPYKKFDDVTGSAGEQPAGRQKGKGSTCQICRAFLFFKGKKMNIKVVIILDNVPPSNLGIQKIKQAVQHLRGQMLLSEAVYLDDNKTLAIKISNEGPKLYNVTEDFKFKI